MRSPENNRRSLRRWISGALLAVVAGAVVPAAQAQHGSMDFGMNYVQERTKFVGSTDANYFYLRGATLDLSYTVWKGLGLMGSGTGLAASNLHGNIDIHHVEVLGGAVYTRNFGHITPAAYGRRGGVFAEARGGYTFATAGLYPSGGALSSHASGLTYTFGGGANLHVYQRFDVRVLQVDYVITRLPNGGSNQQNTLRFSSGLNFHFGL